MRIRILGVGMGPQHVTAEVAEALASVDYVLAAQKASDDGDHDELLAIRQAILNTYGREDKPPEVVAVPDPERDRSAELSSPGYQQAVAEWHRKRADAYAAILREREGTAAFLVWGDPSLYDSTIRIVELVRNSGLDVDYDVLPGISAPQVLAARHRIVLHDIGRPVHLTTGRRLREATWAGLDNIVAMLNPPPSRWDVQGLEDWDIWWGANLGAPGERLVSGRMGEVMPAIIDSRAAAKAEAGWVMDAFLLRRT